MKVTFNKLLSSYVTTVVLLLIYAVALAAATFIEKYYGTSTLPSLPTSFQEAVILLAEKDSDYWRRFNVSENVIRKFTGYRNLVLQNRNNPQLPQLIKNSFGDTYWSYYLLK